MLAGIRWSLLLLSAGSQASSPGILFSDSSAASGLDVVLRHSPTPEKHQIETMPGGVAVLDYDGDGRPDLYFVNGARQPQLDRPDATWSNRLYRNVGSGRFQDVTDRAGVGGGGYGMGAAAADYDNDGDPDLFVAGVTGNLLYRNDGDGTFSDVTAQAGLSTPASATWSIGAGWFDYDADGHLDLFVVNYVKWNPSQEVFCGDAVAGYRTYCHPKYYEGLPNRLYRNRGDGTFADVSAASGIAAHVGKGMAVAFADYDDDGDPDALVTNDTVPNFLFRNDGQGRFREVALSAGVAFNDDGRALSSMGVDFRDVDNDGREDLFVTALSNESFPLYRNLGKGLFEDVTYPSRIGAATLAWSGWGAAVADFDNDGWKDVLAANGDVQDNTERFSSRQSRQPNLLLRNRADGTFGPVPLPGGAAFHRGLAVADFDGDGRLDVVVTRLGERPLLLRNLSPGAGHWLAVKLVGRASNRDGLGAKLRLVTGSGQQRWNHATTAVGYASSSEALVRFGLGGETVVRSLEVRWPSGTVQTLESPTPDRVLTVREP